MAAPLATLTEAAPAAALLRQAFLLDPDLAFLNHGSYGACPAEVLAVQHGWQQQMERNPVLFLGRRSAHLLGQAREPLAAMLGVAADELAFIANATTGVNILAQSLAWSGRLQAGDEVLATDHEYGACDETWRRVCARHGAHYRSVRIPLPFERERFAEHMLAAVTPRTRVIFASHIASTTALIFPLAGLCAAARERGIFTVIDGAHAPGQIDVDLAALGADAYTGNCHKWLCAPKGAAFVHVRPEHHGQLHAPITSWGDVAGDPQGSQPASPYDGYTGTTTLQRRLQWQGTRDITAFLSVPAALHFQQRHQWPAVRQRCHDMAVALMHRVARRLGTQVVAADEDFAQMVIIPMPRGTGIATVNGIGTGIGTVNGNGNGNGAGQDDPDGLRRRLFDDYQIEVPCTQHLGQSFVRVSVQGYNTAADLQRLEVALDQLAG